MPNRLARRLAVAALLSLTLQGCGSAPAVPPETQAAFSKAIAAYLKANHYQMKITSFREAKIEGDQATALCKMQGSQGIHGITVIWKFSLRKEADGWKVVAYSAL